MGGQFWRELAAAEATSPALGNYGNKYHKTIITQTHNFKSMIMVKLKCTMTVNLSISGKRWNLPVD